MSIPNFSKGEYLKALLYLPGVLAFVVYGLTIPPTLQVGDAGEQIAAAHFLGISHPTGTPLYLLIMKLWELIFPFGTIVWRMNILNAVLSSATVIIFARLVYSIFVFHKGSPVKGIIIAIPIAVTLAYSKTFWYESIDASSYSLHYLFVVVWLSILTRIVLKGEYGKLYILYLLTGLAMANHILSLILSFLTLWYSISLLIRKDISFKKIFRLQFCLLPGFVIYLYVPIRSAADPVLNWGIPNSIVRLFHYFIRKDYYMKSYVSTLSEFLNVAAYHLKAYASEMTPLLPLLVFIFVILAIFYRYKNKSKAHHNPKSQSTPVHVQSISFDYKKPLYQLCVLGIILMVLNLVFVSIHGSYLDIFIWKRYMVTGYIGLLFTSIILLILTSSVNRGRYFWIFAIILFLVPSFCLASHFNRNNRSNNNLLETFVKQLFVHLPQSVTFYAQGDNYLFPLLYYHLVERQRPDLILFNPEMGLGNWSMAKSLIIEGKLYSSHYFKTKMPVGLMARGLVFKFVTETNREPVVVQWDDLSEDEISQAQAPLEKILVVDLFYRRSVYHKNRGEGDLQLFWIDKMAEVADGYDQTLMLTGRAYAGAGHIANAVRYFHAALAINPKDRISQYYLQKLVGERRNQ